MAYYDLIKLVAGDDKPVLSFTLRDSNSAVSGLVLDPDDETTWEPIDITGVTVRVKFRALGSSGILDTMTCTHISSADGTCFMEWNPTTLDVEAGTYEGEIELTYSDGTVLTLFDKLKFKVRAEF